jgi:hypothetical protein
MQLKNIECILQNKSNSFTAETLPKLSAVFNPDRYIGSPISQISALGSARCGADWQGPRTRPLVGQRRGRAAAVGVVCAGKR